MPILLNPPSRKKYENAYTSEYTSELHKLAKQLYDPENETYGQAIARAVAIAQKEAPALLDPTATTEERRQALAKKMTIQNPVYTTDFMKKVKKEFHPKKGPVWSKIATALKISATDAKEKYKSGWQAAVAAGCRKWPEDIKVPDAVYRKASEMYRESPDRYIESLKRRDRISAIQGYTRDDGRHVLAYKTVKGAKGGYGRVLSAIIFDSKEDEEKFTEAGKERLIAKYSSDEAALGRKGKDIWRRTRLKLLVEELNALRSDSDPEMVSIMEKIVPRTDTGEPCNFTQAEGITAISRRIQILTSDELATLNEKLGDVAPILPNPPYEENMGDKMLGLGLATIETPFAFLGIQFASRYACRTIGLRKFVWDNLAYDSKRIAENTSTGNKCTIRRYYGGLAVGQTLINGSAWAIIHWGARLATGRKPLGRLVGDPEVSVPTSGQMTARAYIKPTALSLGGAAATLIPLFTNLYAMAKTKNLPELLNRESVHLSEEEYRELLEKLRTEAGVSLQDWVTVESYPDRMGDYVTTRSEPQSISDYVTTSNEPESISDYVTSRNEPQSLSGQLCQESDEGVGDFWEMYEED